MMDTQFSDNTDSHRFEYHTGGGVAFADYRRQDGTLYIDYVFAPPELRGTGAAGKLMEYIAVKARKEGLTIIPICGYAASWLRRHEDSK